MRMVVRGLVCVAGVLALFLAVQFWLHPAEPAKRLGLEAVGALGMATVRADMAGFFAAAGALSLAAAIRGEAKLMTAPLLMVAVALAGRLFNVWQLGYSPAQAAPMAIEAALVVLFGFARRGL
ncbi:hypothetical protein [Phenylobacterium sp.]|uniref:hypothetical protein n=1 Tax=Phenylobacterium sp. TaxID=1871053 RepID=UPI0035ADB719